MQTTTASLATRLGTITRRARGVRAGVRLFLDPRRLDEVFRLEEVLADERVQGEVMETVRRDERGRAALVERPRLGAIDLERLRALPEGTLGRAFADFLDARGLRPGAIPTRAADDEESYARAHLYETHDIWHVAAGFDVDVAGELGLQAFYLAQLPVALPPWIIAGGLLHALFFARRDFVPRIEAVVRGFRMGRSARPLFGTRWDELWNEPLDEVRARAGLLDDA